MNYGGNTSWLQAGKRDDSKLVIQDGKLDNITAVVRGFGCGRWWYTTDRNGWGGSRGVRETGCNLAFHQTEQKLDGENYWGGVSYHRD